MKKIFLIIALLLMSNMLTGCFGFIVKAPVEAHEIGIIFGDGTSIDDVVLPGRYSDLRIHSRLETIDCSSRQMTWEDPDLWTSDKQPLAFRVTVTYKRSNDVVLIQELWSTYRNIFKNDEALMIMVESRIAESAKEVTVAHTLEGMLGIDTSDGGRNQLQQEMFDALSPELAEFGAVLLNVSINDIGVSDTYKANLEAKANSRIMTELAQQETLRLQEQLLQEQAQTEIDLEIARRNNLVAEELARVYEVSPEAFEIARLEALSNLLGESDLIFIPLGTDLTLLFSDAGVVPIAE